MDKGCPPLQRTGPPARPSGVPPYSRRPGACQTHSSERVVGRRGGLDSLGGNIYIKASYFLKHATTAIIPVLSGSEAEGNLPASLQKGYCGRGGTAFPRPEERTKAMKVLVLNSGSSSVKFQFIQMENESLLAKGIVEKIGSSDAIVTYQPEGKNKIREIREVPNHSVAIELVLGLLLHPQHGVIRDKAEIAGIGHRVVHGGEDFSASVLITDKVKSTIRKCIQFAPLHNPHNLKGIEACEALLPKVPQVGVFDTAFHQTIPPRAFIYGLPYALYRKLSIRRYGFHGTSHSYVAHRAAEMLGRPIDTLKIITCHLGNGASITAVDGGKSVDTTMGFTPLEGLVMGTRCGSIDPALVPYIMEKEKLGTKEIDSIMNKNSGMLGLTETSHDMREIEQEAARGSERHKLALEIYCHSVRKFIGAYMAVMGGVDAIVFTGGIGENSRLVRRLVSEGLEGLGIVFDAKRNEANEHVISTGRIKLLVVPTNEELAIARDTQAILQALPQVKDAAPSRPAESAPEAAFTPDETAKLVLMWAQNPKTGAAALAAKWSGEIGRPVGAETVSRELERLSLAGPAAAKKTARKK
jgi:acetate kinase